MKFHITSLSEKLIPTKYGDKTKFTFINQHDKRYYSAFAKDGYTNKFANGFEFEADVMARKYNGKQYYDIQWPSKQGYTPTLNEFANKVQLNDMSIHAKLDEIRNRIDAIALALNIKTVCIKKTPQEMCIPDIEDAPTPTDRDIERF